jgi:hypothetical protein
MDHESNELQKLEAEAVAKRAELQRLLEILRAKSLSLAWTAQALGERVDRAGRPFGEIHPN